MCKNKQLKGGEIEALRLPKTGWRRKRETLPTVTQQRMRGKNSPRQDRRFLLDINEKFSHSVKLRERLHSESVLCPALEILKLELKDKSVTF